MAFAGAICCCIALLRRGPSGNGTPTDMKGDAAPRPVQSSRDDSRGEIHAMEPSSLDPAVYSDERTTAKKDSAPVEAPSTEGNLVDEEQRLVDEFDNLTDTWQEPTSRRISMQDVDRFRENFNRIPSSRKEECLQRALNLIPDENVELLAGILFDKAQEKELIELVYNDVLNRDETVKRPLLQLIFKDKTHPCWTDTAWILDVTDDLPNKEKGRKE